jgi:formate hydrogenlyase transcriptional activator
VGADGRLREVEYVAKANVLPARHLLVLRDTHASGTRETGHASTSEAPAWVQDYALFLLDTDGRIAAWYTGAERIFGYGKSEAVGNSASLLSAGGHASEDARRVKLQEELRRATAEGHVFMEDWRLKKGGSRFWANSILTALRDEQGLLRGFAGVIRDFTERPQRDQSSGLSPVHLRALPAQTTIIGVVSGEFDRIPEANDAFLELVGYSREDLRSGRLSWPDLTPPEYLLPDELAYEEGLRFGACTPFEKELIRKDGTRVLVLVATAVLKLAPFRWITFVQDLRERDRQERIDPETVEIRGDFEGVIGTSAAMKRVMGQAEVVASTNATVLILGETGTGKELIARAIHRMSPRRNLPFITLNCAAIPPGLLESELFGYEKGAFTGALTQKIGRFELAHQGTLFLDEVGDIPLDLQPKLLRALQEKAFERLGGTKTIPIDVRLLAATNRNLIEMMGDKLFRSDLYYRLNVFPIVTPALRDHPEDIPVLARHFTEKYARQMDRAINKIPLETMRALMNWPWPGNVRELENFIERSVILSRGRDLDAPLDELLVDVAEGTGVATLKEVERNYILRVFRENGGVISTTAARLGMPRTTLNALMKKLRISRRDL